MAEDKDVVEAQQSRLLEAPERPLFDICSDSAQMQGRRPIQRWMDEAPLAAASA